MYFQLIEDSNYILMITEDDNVSTVPNDSNNRHWQMYQAWLAEGNIPEEAE